MENLEDFIANNCSFIFLPDNIERRKPKFSRKIRGALKETFDFYGKKDKFLPLQVEEDFIMTLPSPEEVESNAQSDVEREIEDLREDRCLTLSMSQFELSRDWSKIQSDFRFVFGASA